MITIGLTGGIGTGKSEVGRILQSLGASHIDADKLGHEVYKPNTEGWHTVVAAFGKGIVLPDGEIDRKQLGSIVFSDPAQLATLNQIMHPRIALKVEERKRELAAQGVKVAVLEAAILIEGGWQRLVDEIWVTATDEAVIIQRLHARNGLSREAALARIKAQMPQSERVKHAQAVIWNNGNLEQLRQAVTHMWKTRIENRTGEHVHI